MPMSPARMARNVALVERLVERLDRLEHHLKGLERRLESIERHAHDWIRGEDIIHIVRRIDHLEEAARQSDTGSTGERSKSRKRKAAQTNRDDS